MGKSVDRKQVDDYKLSLGRFRDVVKKNFDGIELVVLGLELQEHIHYGMPLRTMIYDSLGAATTISEVERRTRNLVSELQKRHIHQDVIKCCKEEYLQENYFHAVFEAAKSLSEKVREKTGMQEDGSNLFNNAFAVNNPRLAINSLQTPSEKMLKTV